MNGHIVLNMHSKTPGGNIGIFFAIQDGEYEIVINGIILALLKSIKKGKTKC